MAYTPGVTNIDPIGAKERKKDAWKAVGAALVYAALIFLFSVPQVLMFGVMVPVWFATIRFFEARKHFSVSYGLHGLYDDGEGVKHTPHDEESQAKDRTRAESMMIVAGAVSLVLGVIAYFVLV